jgi:hypothetical protein
MSGTFRPGPAFSFFVILDVAPLRLRLQNHCGLGRGRNLPFLDGHSLKIMEKQNRNNSLETDYNWIGFGVNFGLTSAEFLVI